MNAGWQQRARLTCCNAHSSHTPCTLDDLLEFNNTDQACTERWKKIVWWHDMMMSHSLTNYLRNYIDNVLITNMACSTLIPLPNASWQKKINTVMRKTQRVEGRWSMSCCFSKVCVHVILCRLVEELSYIYIYIYIYIYKKIIFKSEYVVFSVRISITIHVIAFKKLF